MFHNVLMTNLTPLRDTNELHNWDNRPFATIWPEIKQEKIKETYIKKTIKKKNKRNRTTFTTEQIRALEHVFARTKYIDIERRKEIAACLQMDQKCIKIWFQNRRMKEKKELSESYESASESIPESMSPPLETLQPIDQSENTYLAPHPESNVRHSNYYYYASNNYLQMELQNERNTYETGNNSVSPVYTNLDANGFTNNTDYSANYYQPQMDFNYLHNTDYNNVHNNYVHSNVTNWPVNSFNSIYK